VSEKITFRLVEVTICAMLRPNEMAHCVEVLQPNQNLRGTEAICADASWQ
jgi:hypothetical protein